MQIKQGFAELLNDMSINKKIFMDTDVEDEEEASASETSQESASIQQTNEGGESEQIEDQII